MCLTLIFTFMFFTCLLLLIAFYDFTISDGDWCSSFSTLFLHQLALFPKSTTLKWEKVLTFFYIFKTRKKPVFSAVKRTFDQQLTWHQVVQQISPLTFFLLSNCRSIFKLYFLVQPANTIGRKIIFWFSCFSYFVGL